MLLGKLRKMLDARELSVRELADAYLDRIEKSDTDMPAYLHVDREGVAAAAERAQARIDAREQSALTGIPLALGDNICTSDMPTTCASRMLDGYRPPYDATVVERLRADGALTLGKLNIAEFGMGVCPGPAAAVAGELCAAALGVDTGGTLRQPAAFHGVTRFTPTYGRVSRHGCVAYSSSFDQAGPVALSAADCAILLDAVSGPCGYDQTTAAYAKTDCAGRVGAGDSRPLRGLRVGVIRELADSSGCVARAAAWFEGAGAAVSEVSLPLLRYSVPAFGIISNAEASANLARYDGVRFGHSLADARDYKELIVGSRAAGFGYEAKLRILFGTFALSSGSYEAYFKKAIRLAQMLRAQYDAAFASYDVLLSPAATPVDVAQPSTAYDVDGCTAGPALAGLPSVTTPCGDINGQPCGLMITGARGHDERVLAAAAAFERGAERHRDRSLH